MDLNKPPGKEAQKRENVVKKVEKLNVIHVPEGKEVGFNGNESLSHEDVLEGEYSKVSEDDSSKNLSNITEDDNLHSYLQGDDDTDDFANIEMVEDNEDNKPLHTGSIEFICPNQDCLEQDPKEIQYRLLQQYYNAIHAFDYLPNKEKDGSITVKRDAKHKQSYPNFSAMFDAVMKYRHDKHDKRTIAVLSKKLSEVQRATQKYNNVLLKLVDDNSPNNWTDAKIAAKELKIISKELDVRTQKTLLKDQKGNWYAQEAMRIAKEYQGAMIEPNKLGAYLHAKAGSEEEKSNIKEKTDFLQNAYKSIKEGLQNLAQFVIEKVAAKVKVYLDYTKDSDLALNAKDPVKIHEANENSSNVSEPELEVVNKRVPVSGPTMDM